ncbi:MAG: hypothetical protein IJW73_04140 [Candidatus Gastranaerophilales bacterium]|nr:hypothetical protein [Candidatus Gastranaerophilales bacterium]
MDVFISLLCILLIFITLPSVQALIKLEIKVNELNATMLNKAREMLEINDQVQTTLKKVNKVLRILSDKRIHQIKSMVFMTMDIVQAVMLLRSLKVAKGKKKIDFPLLRKIAYARIAQEILRKLLSGLQNFCAI